MYQTCDSTAPQDGCKMTKIYRDKENVTKVKPCNQEPWTTFQMCLTWDYWFWKLDAVPQLICQRGKLIASPC